MRRAPDQLIRRGHRCHRIIEAFFWSIAAAHVEDHDPHPAADSHFGSHTVRPEAVQLAIFQRLGGRYSEIDASTLRARNRRDLDLVALDIDSGLDQEPAKPEINPRRSADPASLHHAYVTASGFEIAVHHQEPVHSLRLGAQELDAAPPRKGSESGMCRP